MTFKESSILSAGNKLGILDTGTLFIVIQNMERLDWEFAMTLDFLIWLKRQLKMVKFLR